VLVCRKQSASTTAHSLAEIGEVTEYGNDNSSSRGGDHGQERGFQPDLEVSPPLMIRLECTRKRMTVLQE